MAYVEEALFDLVNADADVSADVGTRIYSGRAPEDTAYPLLIYQKVSGVRVDDHGRFGSRGPALLVPGLREDLRGRGRTVEQSPRGTRQLYRHADGRPDVDPRRERVGSTV